MENSKYKNNSHYETIRIVNKFVYALFVCLDGL